MGSNAKYASDNNKHLDIHINKVNFGKKII